MQLAASALLWFGACDRRRGCNVRRGGARDDTVVSLRCLATAGDDRRDR
jgi:hypothetical protein